MAEVRVPAGPRAAAVAGLVVVTSVFHIVCANSMRFVIFNTLPPALVIAFVVLTGTAAMFVGRNAERVPATHGRAFGYGLKFGLVYALIVYAMVYIFGLMLFL